MSLFKTASEIAIMKSVSNAKPFALNGKLHYRMMSIGVLYWCTIVVSLRRAFRGPLIPGWSWAFEVATHFLRRQTAKAFDMADPNDGREYEDSLVFHSPALEQVIIEPVSSPVKGHWFRTKKQSHDVTLLYLHGGGYAYYSAAHHNLISLVTLAAGSQTFTLDYRLIPEHPFPAQLEDARNAYR